MSRRTLRERSQVPRAPILPVEERPQVYALIEDQADESDDPQEEKVVVAGLLVAPRETGLRAEIGHQDFPIRVWDGETTHFQFDVPNQELTAVGVFRNAFSAPRWVIGSDPQFNNNTIFAELPNRDNPARIGAFEDDLSDLSYLDIQPPNSYVNAFHNPIIELDAHQNVSDDGLIMILPGGFDANDAELWLGGDDIRLITGHQAQGFCSGGGVGLTSSRVGVTYGGVSRLQNTPSSVSLSGNGHSDANVSLIDAVHITTRGFSLRVNQDTSGGFHGSRHYVTVGN